MAQKEHPEAVDINGDILDYTEDADESLHVEVYTTHNQMESSQDPLDYSPLDREIAQDASNLLDVGMDSDLDESVDQEEPKDCASKLANLSARLGIAPPAEEWTTVKKRMHRSPIRVPSLSSPPAKPGQPGSSTGAIPKTSKAKEGAKKIRPPKSEVVKVRANSGQGGECFPLGCSPRAHLHPATNPLLTSIETVAASG